MAHQLIPLIMMNDTEFLIQIDRLETLIDIKYPHKTWSNLTHDALVDYWDSKREDLPLRIQELEQELDLLKNT